MNPENPLSNPQPNWIPLSALSPRYHENLKALKSRDKSLADRLTAFHPNQSYCVGVESDRIQLAVGSPPVARELQPVVPAPLAKQYLAQLFPNRCCDRSVLVIGEDQGWLWDAVYKTPCVVAAMPGHQPPLYFIIREIERLWTILHLQEWRELLADPRVIIFAGEDASAQLEHSLVQNVKLPWPTSSCTIDNTPWPNGANLNDVVESASTKRQSMLDDVRRKMHGIYANPTATAAFTNNPARPLRVLGVTSRYTTFLQYSMRDWLAGFDQLGHETRLVIEPADHALTGELGIALACIDFKPDLLVCIDHFRAELGHIPAGLPVVMWVQDRLPNIFSAAAGSAQGPTDFCLGFARLHLSKRYGYPIDRFMHARIGVNPQRFSDQPATAGELEKFACDVSFVSNASTAPLVLLERLKTNADGPISGYLDELFERVQAHFESGREMFTDAQLLQLMSQTAERKRIGLNQQSIDAIQTAFRDQICNAIFRQQALQWVADAGADLRLYGRGWEAHPSLGRYARGIADNQNQLAAIYRATKINLQITPFGAVHPRLLDGLTAGAFFLIRRTAGDNVGLCHQELWNWISRNNITDETALHKSADGAIREIIRKINSGEGTPDGKRDLGLLEVCQAHADAEFGSSADSVWPQYPQVAFQDRHELQQKLTFFLANPRARHEIAHAMRQVVIDRFGYASISRRLLEMIASHQIKHADFSTTEMDHAVALRQAA